MIFERATLAHRQRSPNLSTWRVLVFGSFPHEADDLALRAVGKLSESRHTSSRERLLVEDARSNSPNATAESRHIIPEAPGA